MRSELTLETVIICVQCIFPLSQAMRQHRSGHATPPRVQPTAWLTSWAAQGGWATATSCQPTWAPRRSADGSAWAPEQAHGTFKSAVLLLSLCVFKSGLSRLIVLYPSICYDSLIDWDKELNDMVVSLYVEQFCHARRDQSASLLRFGEPFWVD